MVINLRRYRRKRADKTGRTWCVGNYRRDRIGALRYLCVLNGEDVTHRTFYVDSRRGIVRMYLLNEDGKVYLDSTGVVATVEQRGRVKLIRAEVA
jgi:hypothetical protein